MTIPLRCSSSCNPPCEVAWYKDGQLHVKYRVNPVIKITRDRRMSGIYQCEASGVEGKVKSAQVHFIIQCKLFVIIYTYILLVFFRGGGWMCAANETQKTGIEIVRDSGYLWSNMKFRRLVILSCLYIIKLNTGRIWLWQKEIIHFSADTLTSFLSINPILRLLHFFWRGGARIKIHLTLFISKTNTSLHK